MTFIEHNIKGKPITMNGYIELRCRSVTLKNNGDETIEIDNGKWTLVPGESFSYSVTEPNEIIVQKLMVKFDGTGSNPRLEVVEGFVKDPSSAHYIKSPKFR